MIAQITRMSIAIIVTDQMGYAARKLMFTIELTKARMTASARAHIFPANRPTPAAAIRMPPMMCTQPQVV